jgi:hypothetical protein
MTLRGQMVRDVRQWVPVVQGGQGQCFTRGAMRPRGQTRQRGEDSRGYWDSQEVYEEQDGAVGHIVQPLYTYYWYSMSHAE